MRRLFVLPMVLAALATILVAAPAQATTIVSDTGHLTIDSYGPTASGNWYDNWTHLAIGKDGSTYTPRVHFHCRKNGSVYDGCRVDADLVLERLEAVWEHVTTTHIANPGGSFDCCSGAGWYADTSTQLGGAAGISAGVRIRVCLLNTISRIRLGDGTNHYNGNAAERCTPSYTT